MSNPWAKYFEVTDKYKGPQFNKGDHFYDFCSNKYGIVKRLRDDRWEQQYSWPKNEYFYHVDYDDDSFETYLGQRSMVKQKI